MCGEIRVAAGHVSWGNWTSLKNIDPLHKHVSLYVRFEGGGRNEQISSWKKHRYFNTDGPLLGYINFQQSINSFMDSWLYALRQFPTHICSKYDVIKEFRCNRRPCRKKPEAAHPGYPVILPAGTSHLSGSQESVLLLSILHANVHWLQHTLDFTYPDSTSIQSEHS